MVPRTPHRARSGGAASAPGGGGGARRGAGAAGAGVDPRIERGLGAATLGFSVLAAVAAHAAFFRNAGALWRDEANLAAFASMRSLAEIVASLRFDSVPLLPTLLFRVAAGPGGGGDTALRVVGGLVGLAVLATLTAASLRRRCVVPLATLALLGLNAWVIRGGDAVRPAGLAMLGVVLAFVALARALERPGRAAALLAALACVASVQAAYANAPLVGVLAVAGAVTGARERSALRVAIALGAGGAAALSLLPYGPAVSAAREWGELVRSHADFTQALVALQATSGWDAALWGALVLAGLVVGARSAFARPAVGSDAAGGDPAASRRLALFSTVVLVAGPAALAGFMAWTRLVTQPWYYLPAMALAAAALDVLLGGALRSPAARLAAYAGTLLVLALHFVAVLPRVSLRQTNVDRLAAAVASRAVPGDLVVVHPWFLGVTFQRYYAGRAAWTTIPPLADSRIHRYDLLARRMLQPGMGDSVGEAMARTLDAGRRVWLVGMLPALDPGERPPAPAPAPSPAFGWNSDLHVEAWAKRAVAASLPHVGAAEPLAVPRDGLVQPLEDVPAFVLSGRPPRRAAEGAHAPR